MNKTNSPEYGAKEIDKGEHTEAEIADGSVEGVMIGFFYKLCTVGYLIAGSFLMLWNLSNSHKYHA